MANVKINNWVLSGKKQEEMLNNGWHLMVKDNCGETDEEFIERLQGCGYNQIKLYEDTTRIRGLHNVFAMVKRVSNHKFYNNFIITKNGNKWEVRDCGGILIRTCRTLKECKARIDNQTL